MPRIERNEDNIYMLYTGGTTGMPKGVMYTHGGFVNSSIDVIYLKYAKAEEVAAILNSVSDRFAASPDGIKTVITHHEKTNGVLIRVVVSNVPEVKDIAGWVGQENWFYLTLNEAVFAEGVLENLVTSSPILEIEGIQNKQSVQIGFLMENYISDFEIFHSPSNRVFLIHVWHELDGSNIADIRKSESENSNKIFSLNDQNSKGTPFYESFISIPKTC